MSSSSMPQPVRFFEHMQQDDFTRHARVMSGSCSRQTPKHRTYVFIQSCTYFVRGPSLACSQSSTTRLRGIVVSSASAIA
eukprot:6213888-Pleurochrysis_carterae.AAC.1